MPITFESVAIPAADTTWRIDVSIYYTNAMLIFTGHEKMKSATPEFFVEVKRTSDGHTIARASRTDTLRTDVPLSKTLSQHEIFSFPISAPGSYTVTLELSGASVKYTGSRELRQIVIIPSPKPDSITLADVAICYPALSKNEYERVPYGGNFPFGSGAVCLVPLKEKVDSIAWELQKIKADDERVEPATKRGVSSEVAEGSLEQRATSYTIVPAQGCYIGVIPFNNTLLDQGKYKMTLTAYSGARRGIFSQDIYVKWGEMPVSLANLEFAIEALTAIATVEEKEYITSGNDAEMLSKFNEFWKRRDPSPETPYNEYLAEYYKRVDYAYFNFATISEENGVKTDRGKVYMLFGAPTQTQRIFAPNGAPQEVWMYKNNVARKFMFTDKARDGNYKLVSEEKL